MSVSSNSMRRALAFLGMVVLALSAVALGPAGKARAAANVAVELGYADDLRANPANFPTPWNGSPGVVFNGCTGSCSFDGGAIRFINNTGIQVHVDYVKVHFGTCTFDLWNKNVPLDPGQSLIDTQTISGPSGGCPADGSFDTSDVGPNGANWSGHCDQSGVTPVVEFSVDGQPGSVTDSGQILNTKGVDGASCGMGNESQQWAPAGSVPCPGSTLALSPATQTDAVGSSAKVTAKLANSCGDPLQGAKIDFAVAGGPNAGATGSAVTDVNGNASFSYSGAVTGTDVVGSFTTNPAGTITSNTVKVVWVKRTPTLTIDGASATGDYNDPATVSGTLTDSAGPIAGASVTFTLNGAETCTGTTAANGSVSCSLTPGEAAGSYPLAASYAGSATDDPAGATGTFVVTREETTIVYTGSAHAANGRPYTLSGSLKEDGATPIAGRTVTFTLGSGASAQSCTGTTDASGDASCTLPSVNQPNAATVPATAVFAGDAYYVPASASLSGGVAFTTMTGKAFGLSSSGLVGITPTPLAGPVSTTVPGTSNPPCVATISGLINAATLCADVSTAISPNSSTANASVQHVGIGVLGLPAIQIGAVTSTSHTECGGGTGDATVASITVGGIAVPVSVHPGPNTTVNVLGVKLILNEQVHTDTATDHVLTVNAVHVVVPGLLDTVVASSTSDIHGCF
ncbi:Ig-like domain-containing protein [Catenulispora subtropica]|uniref:Big-1 domain-containing protein n=1 Tax=Catenulispora subtropica TaxID=450798 RepID=A0ABP5E910_9ACTN